MVNHCSQFSAVETQFCHRNPILHMILWKETILNFSKLIQVTKTWPEKGFLAILDQSTSRGFQKCHICMNIRYFVDGLCHSFWPLCIAFKFRISLRIEALFYKPRWLNHFVPCIWCLYFRGTRQLSNQQIYISVLKTNYAAKNPISV